MQNHDVHRTEFGGACERGNVRVGGALVQNQDVHRAELGGAFKILKLIPGRSYKQFQRQEPLRFDLLIDNGLLVAGNSVEEVVPIHQAQLLGYMKLLEIPLGLIPGYSWPCRPERAGAGDAGTAVACWPFMPRTEGEWANAAFALFRQRYPRPCSGLPV